ncbi:hypothetical protein A943_02955 [Bacillus sp. CPSM8]|nr:hypothetical protein A943_02955 [Bacillus sp. CPSM8]KND09433.1 hypothetical protein ACJ43_02350 [Bacillus paralicheniformis]KUL12316.1 hypothetical protein LI7559_08915 [Bacillus licheniformis LMG 7559]KRT90805.1 hypothetical protein ACH97_217635 [Bacillus paralicheniformis]OCI07354.1 hypothetical protein BBP22_14490 [Bacillus paralicheniformis]
MPESLFFLLTETSDMIAARTAASDFSERKRKIARKQKEIEETIKKLKDMKMSFSQKKEN